MLSVFRKKIAAIGGKYDNEQLTSDTPNATAISLVEKQLQKKFARGVQYNLKILIKGDRNVGKTCLFNRLQGKPFCDDYTPTEEIQAASIQWNYRATDDVIKVDAWDVVDKSRIKRKKMDGLKMKNHIHEFEEARLDADFIDIYKNAHGVLLVFDITKAWTWEYVQREISQIPGNLPILILANRLDMSHHRQVRQEQASFFVECLDRGPTAAKVSYAEASMRNGFGLKLIYLFFNIPFLILQKETLLKQLETNTKEIELSYEEMNFFMNSDENDYQKFSNNLNERRRTDAEKVAPKSTSDVVFGNSDAKPCVNPVISQFSGMVEKNKKIDKGQNEEKSTNTFAIKNGDGCSPVKANAETSSLMGTVEKLKRVNLKQTATKKVAGPVKNVDEFVPDDEGVEASFFEDLAENATVRPQNLNLRATHKKDSDYEDEIANGVAMAGRVAESDEEAEIFALQEVKLTGNGGVAKSDFETPMAYNLPIFPNVATLPSEPDSSAPCIVSQDPSVPALLSPSPPPSEPSAPKASELALDFSTSLPKSSADLSQCMTSSTAPTFYAATDFVSSRFHSQPCDMADPSPVISARYDGAGDTDDDDDGVRPNPLVVGSAPCGDWSDSSDGDDMTSLGSNARGGENVGKFVGSINVATKQRKTVKSKKIDVSQQSNESAIKNMKNPTKSHVKSEKGRSKSLSNKAKKEKSENSRSNHTTSRLNSFYEEI